MKMEKIHTEQVSDDVYFIKCGNNNTLICLRPNTEYDSASIISFHDDTLSIIILNGEAKIRFKETGVTMDLSPDVIYNFDATDTPIILTTHSSAMLLAHV